jgi:hypothetical protein
MGQRGRSPAADGAVFTGLAYESLYRKVANFRRTGLSAAEERSAMTRPLIDPPHYLTGPPWPQTAFWEITPRKSASRQESKAPMLARFSVPTRRGLTSACQINWL